MFLSNKVTSFKRTTKSYNWIVLLLVCEVSLMYVSWYVICRSHSPFWFLLQVSQQNGREKWHHRFFEGSEPYTDSPCWDSGQGGKTCVEQLKYEISCRTSCCKTSGEPQWTRTKPEWNASMLTLTFWV